MPLIKHVPQAAQPPVTEATEIKVAPPAPVEAKAESKPPVARKASSDTMSKDEWAAKDRRISRSGVWQACVQSVILGQYAPTLEDFKKLVREMAEEGLKFVNSESK